VLPQLGSAGAAQDANQANEIISRVKAMQVQRRDTIKGSMGEHQIKRLTVVKKD
jgi:hypothetical protein